MAEIEVENGTVEFASSPGHINLIAEDHDDDGAEVRLTAEQRDQLIGGMVDDRNVELDDIEGGVVAWEPGRGLYIESFSGDGFYLVMSPMQVGDVVKAAQATEPA